MSERVRTSLLQPASDSLISRGLWSLTDILETAITTPTSSGGSRSQQSSMPFWKTPRFRAAALMIILGFIVATLFLAPEQKEQQPVSVAK
jgi:hypothetical protein